LLAQGKRRAQLEQWLTQDLEAWFAGRVFSVDRQVAMRWASVAAQGTRNGAASAAIDSLIGATALAHDLVIVTRNTKDFEERRPLIPGKPRGKPANERADPFTR